MFSNCQIRDYSETCYARHSTDRDENVCLMEMINNVVGPPFSDKVKT
jgi:hypothetical protein